MRSERPRRRSRGACDFRRRVRRWLPPVAKRKLKVAVTGPTGDIGRPFLRALERSPQVAEIRGMARRPFDPDAEGLKRTTYVQGDILEPGDLDRLVDGVDVVVHLAFIIFGSAQETRAV